MTQAAGAVFEERKGHEARNTDGFQKQEGPQNIIS